MKEFRRIVEEYRKVDFAKHKAALATVVRVMGSSYRSPGARMLITDDGRWVGSISGGCLEGDALRKARQVMLEERPMTIRYDTREESNQNLGIGLGCNGVIDVFIEPLDPNNHRNPVVVFGDFMSVTSPVALATVFNGPSLSGEKMLLDSSNRITQTLSNAQLAEELYPYLVDVGVSRKSHARSFNRRDGTYEIFLEYIQPSISLIIFGGGFDARPVSDMAKALGWEVTVTDECVAHIAPVFFPTADKLSLCDRKFIEKDFQIGEFTACVLMSHNYEYDRDVLKTLARSRAPYIGILGPRKRFVKMIADIAAAGIEISPTDERIHSPIGLDIGAEAPDEIALSIIAEIQGKFANRSGGFLKYRSGPIHHRNQADDQVYKEMFILSADQKAAQSHTP